jgi:hypothetical protein
MAAGFAVAAALLAALYYVLKRRFCKTKKKKVEEEKSSTGIAFTLKVLIGVFQIIVSFEHSIDIEWPSFYTNLIAWPKIPVNLEAVTFPAYGCIVGSSFYTTFMVTTIAPVVVVFALFLLYIVFRPIPSLHRFLGWSKFIQWFLFVLFFVYPRTSQVILSTFNCYELANGESFLIADPRIMCTGEHVEVQYVAFQFYAVIGIGVYTLGIPLIFLGMLWVRRHYLYDPYTGVPSVAAVRSMGILYAGYRPEWYWWELVEIARKLFLCAAIQFLGQSPSQCLLAILGETAYQALFGVADPFAHSSDNWMSTIAGVEIFSVLLLALMIKANFAAAENYDDERFNVIMQAAVYIPVAVVAIFSILKILKGAYWDPWMKFKSGYPLYHVSFWKFQKYGGVYGSRIASAKQDETLAKSSPGASEVVNELKGWVHSCQQMALYQDAIKKIARSIRSLSLASTGASGRGRRLDTQKVSKVGDAVIAFAKAIGQEEGTEEGSSKEEALAKLRSAAWGLMGRRGTPPADAKLLELHKSKKLAGNKAVNGNLINFKLKEVVQWMGNLANGAPAELPAPERKASRTTVIPMNDSDDTKEDEVVNM